MLTTSDFTYVIFNGAELGEFLKNVVINPAKIIVVEISQDVWLVNKQLRMNFSDRIIISQPSNLNKGYLLYPDSFTTYAKIGAIDLGLQKSILRQLRRYSQ